MSNALHSPRLPVWLAHPSGGLSYHLRALRYRNTLWAAFRAQASQWLANWEDTRDTLVIVGPSAGYTLDLSFLQRFQHITLIEPDPLARLLFQRRFRTARSPKHYSSVSLDCFASPEGPYVLAQRFPEASILFANVIGQLLEEGAAPAWRAALNQALAHRSWASYHDVVSTDRAPRDNAPLTIAGQPLETVLAHFWQGGELRLRDHHTYRLRGPTHSTQYAVWQLTPTHYHLIEWTCG